jgi:hypothetical protein
VPVLANPLALALALALVGSHLRHVISTSISIIGSSRRNTSCFNPKRHYFTVIVNLKYSTENGI